MNVMGFLFVALSGVTLTLLILSVVVPTCCIYFKLTNKKTNYDELYALIDRNEKMASQREKDRLLEIAEYKRRWAKKLLSERDFKRVDSVVNDLNLDYGKTVVIFINGGQLKIDIMRRHREHIISRYRKPTAKCKADRLEQLEKMRGMQIAALLSEQAVDAQMQAQAQNQAQVWQQQPLAHSQGQAQGKVYNWLTGGL